jgi:hypothetical protein
MHNLIIGNTDMIDHIDNNGLNNCRNNLRLCTARQNTVNSQKMSSHTRKLKSEYKGIAFVKRSKINPWKTVICVNGKRMHIGCYSTEQEAARAYDEAAKQYFGEFAKVNFE